MSGGRIVVDTGVLLAAADADDHWHHQASAVVEARAADQLVLPVPVAAETAWMIGSRLGAATEAAFVASVARASSRSPSSPGRTGLAVRR